MSGEATEIRIEQTIANLAGLMEWNVLSKYAREDGYIEDRHKALVLYENKRACAFLILKREDNAAKVVEMSDARDGRNLTRLFRAAVNCAEANGLNRIEVEIEKTEGPALIANLLRDGFVKKEDLPAHFIFDNPKVLQRQNVANIDKVVPFYELPMASLMNFLSNNRSALDDMDYVGDDAGVAFELCMAYVENEEILGYVLCKYGNDEIYAYSGYAMDFDPVVLETLLGVLAMRKEEFYPKLGRLRVKCFSENTEEALRLLLGRQVAEKKERIAIYKDIVE